MYGPPMPPLPLEARGGPSQRDVDPSQAVKPTLVDWGPKDIACDCCKFFDHAVLMNDKAHCPGCGGE
jgi:hypothetical protein